MKANWLLLIVCASVAMSCGQRCIEFITLVFVLPTLLYQTIQCLRSWRSPEQRAVRLAAIMIVLMSLLVVYGNHLYHDYVTRTDADHLVQTIEKFRVDNKRYPTTLNELSIDTTKTSHISGLYYDATHGGPSLVYDSTFALADYWFYDFSTHQWNYVSP